MNDRYLFRGKRKDNGEWVCGLLGRYNANYKCANIIDEFECLVPVKTETVGQYTGLKDKNGRRIFEGDIVKAIYKSNYIGVPNIDFGIGVVEYKGTYYNSASYQINIIGESGNRVFSANLEVEVIGTVHDNPELVKGE